MSKLEKNMENLFGITPSPKKMKEVATTEKTEVAADAPFNNRDHIIEDYNKTRVNLEKLIAKTNEAIENAMVMAEDTESPRAYEVLATLLQTAKDLNIQWLENQKRMQDVMGGGQGKSGPPVSQNKIDKAIFIGSTDELSKLLKKERDGEES